VQQHTILFVEDVETCSEPLTRVLRRGGYRVLCATRARQAISLLEESNVDLILVDLALPGVSGSELVETIRATEEWRDLAVIVFSSWGEIGRMSRDLRISAWLIKSLASMRELKQAITEALGKAKR
jgi:DNA-binding response OmpR family regulator